MTQFSRKKIISQAGGGGSSSDSARITTLENNEYKVTYYEIISGASGSLTLPTGATINAGEFGLSGNCILSKIDGSNKPTFESPKTAGGTVVTASLNVSTGAWVASGTYTDSNVALIYSIKIKAIYYSNLTYANIIETINSGGGLSGLTTNKVLKATSSTTAGDSNITDDGTNVVVNGLRIRNISNATYFNASGINGHYWNSFNDAINLFRVKNDGVVNIPQGTSDRIMALDTNKDVVYLSTTVYPSLTELSYGKGVTSAIQTQLDGLAPIASPTFTGTPLAPTASANTNNTQIATTAYVDNATPPAAKLFNYYNFS